MNTQKNNLINKISLKAVTLNSLRAMIESLNKTGINDFQALILTPFGFITGDISVELSNKENYITYSEDKTNYTIDISYVNEMKQNYISKYKKKNPEICFVDNPTFLNLKNVTFYKDDFKTPILTINQYLIFVDQIIGFSLIPRDFDK